MERKKVKLLGIPYDDKSCFMNGPALAPAIIREVLHNGASNYTSESLVDIINDVDLEDLGNIQVGEYMQMQNDISAIIPKDSPVLFLGGDHSITYPIVKSLFEIHGQFDILHFDAHPDLYDHYLDDKYSHACPFARIMEDNLCSRLVQVGIRTLNTHQNEQSIKFGTEIIQMKDLELLKNVRFNNKLYISIDMDAFDPAFAPGVSHHEAGGLSSRDVIDFLNTIETKIIGADIVELNPKRDLNNVTAALCTKLLKEVVAIISKN